MPPIFHHGAVSTPSTPRQSDIIAKHGASSLITGTDSASAQPVYTPVAITPVWDYLYLAVGSVHTSTVTLSVGLGGIALGQVFEQDIPPRSGLNLVLDWEEFRAELGGPIVVWASVGSVLFWKEAVRLV